MLLQHLGNIPYRNDKVVTRLWSPCNLVTTLLQPCHNLVVHSQSHCNLAATLSNPSQGCHNLVTTLSRPCSIFTIPLQPCSHIVYSFTRLPPPRYNHAIISQAHYNLVTTMSCLSQACHNLVTTLSQHSNIFTTLHKLVTTLQACDKVTHIHLMIFILAKTLTKSIEVHSTKK